MNLFVHPNIVKQRYILKAKEVIDLLEKIDDVKVYLSLDDSIKLFGDDSRAVKNIKECTMVISIGGDGTVLRGFETAYKYDLPLLGINVGRLGALCCLQLKDLVNAKSDIFTKLKVTEREVLQLEYKSSTYYALNDIVVAHQNCGYAIESKIEVANKQIDYRSDGVIISTPTGSSAYNNAANGPIIDYHEKLNVITPICPCGANKEYYVVDNQEIIKASLNREDELADIFVDGQNIGLLDQQITIVTSKRPVRLLTK